MQFLSFFPPLIPCADRGQSELPLPINPFGTWARTEFTCVKSRWKFQLWERNRGPSPLRTTSPPRLKRNVTSEMRVWPHR